MSEGCKSVFKALKVVYTVSVRCEAARAVSFSGARSHLTGAR